MTNVSKTTPTLADLRQERGFNQAQCGVSEAMVSFIETGRRLPGPSVLRRMARKFRLRPIELMAACRESMRRASEERERQAHALRRSKAGAR